ncbi:MAG: DUF1638 domain-containing protein [Planctomycetota bacterium]
MKSTKHYIFLACEILSREGYYCASISKNLVDIRLLEQGLHDIGEEKMCSKLQSEIDAVYTEKYDAILLGYGLCNNGIRGLHSKIPLVIPRAHDCITLLLGSKEKYDEYFKNNPGTYYMSVGWIERSKSHLSNPESTTSMMGMGTYEEYVEKYGEDKAKYLMEVLNDTLKNYNKLAYIDTRVGDFEHYKEQVKETAREKGWDYEELDGSTRLILNMMDGQWDENDYLVVQPGQTIEPAYDSTIIEHKYDKENK